MSGKATRAEVLRQDHHLGRTSALEAGYKAAWDKAELLATQGKSVMAKEYTRLLEYMPRHYDLEIRNNCAIEVFAAVLSAWEK